VKLCFSNTGFVKGPFVRFCCCVRRGIWWLEGGMLHRLRGDGRPCRQSTNPRDL